ncbi:SIR2 family protein [Micrococcus terreus]|uniref:SIR2 family protein n=1 Tax=Micrococcus terreus TaxID=574650 RepID=UPI00254A7592|nr:SIR2 family protein [Micrococcus terreus]MDK7701555.1 SIR2 family protein [Micrococcus terreus]WOO98561.1 SIR2 family protein [Micrococcus terreus]
MPRHDVIRFVNGLSEKLASRSRHVCLFVGAGASRAGGLPDVTGLAKHISTTLPKGQKASFEQLSKNRNLEQVLSRVRRIAALLEGTDDQVDGLTSKEAQELDLAICRLIIDQLQVDKANLDPMLHLAAWAARSDYHQALEIFTVNYDLLIETGLESLGVGYFDGFVGTMRARFRSDLIETSGSDERDPLPASFVRLWKLHGSVHWTWDTDNQHEVVRLGAATPDGLPAAIYPSDAKYDESRRVPFVVLQDRLRRALHCPESLIMIAGYSFGDQHLNEVLFEAARRRPRSEFVGFCFDKIPDEVAGLALTAPNFQVVASEEAILGGLRYDWDAPEEAPDDTWANGAFQLGDFAQLARFLARSSPSHEELEARLGDLLAAAAKSNA